MKKIIHFHFDMNKNIGDDAVILSIRDILRELFPNHSYTSRPIFHLTRIEFDHFFKEKIKRSKIVSLRLLPLDFIVSGLVFIMSIVKKVKGTDKKNIVSLINMNDIMIVGGGGIFSKWTLPFDLDLLKQVKVPIVIFGGGYNRNYTDPPLTKDELQSIFNINNIAALSSVRDEKTLSLLEGKADLIGDPAILLKQEQIDINVDSNSFKVGLNIACHEEHVKERLGDILEIYIQTIKKMKMTMRVQVFYLKHSKEEEIVARKLKELIPDITICGYEAKKMMFVYGSLDLVICMMLHSSIFAYANESRFINIGYDEKNFAFMKLIQNEDCMIDLQLLTHNILNEKVDKIISGKIGSKLVKKEFFARKICSYGNKIKEL